MAYKIKGRTELPIPNDYKKIDTKKIQERTLMVFEEVMRICNDNNIDIQLGFGTLLGWARHNKNFIPWDDDIDLVIKREDVPRFMKIIKKELKSMKNWSRWRLKQFGLYWVVQIFLGTYDMK